jgi:hypothetical protein
MGINNVLIYTGYVETSSWAGLGFYHGSKDGFDNATQALRHLAKCILQGFQDSSEYYNMRLKPECCQKYVDNTDQYAFCPKCGTRLVVPKINKEMLEEFIIDLRIGHTDSIPQEVWESLDANGWYLWGDYKIKQTNFENVVVVHQYGEHILAGLALDPNAEVSSNSVYLPEGVRLK